ncbi:type 1 glutamine amidotransferase domain-containing protein [Methanocrinis sp.]|uniref:type 1 glutamine amidotransferase domain-containing protein n=1 Tax=Methanocrinis sp. TaxID=3101522 RepID=UPI003D0D48AA
MELKGKKAALLVAKDYEDLEFWYPYYRMREAGAEVVIVGTADGEETVASKHGYPAEIDLRADEALEEAEGFDGLIVPGGWAPDRLRRCEKTLELVKTIFDDGEVMAAICHGPQVLISADVVRGRRMTSAPAIRDDMRNAGAVWTDEEVVVDGNVISSRSPPDLPAFCREIVRAMR